MLPGDTTSLMKMACVETVAELALVLWLTICPDLLEIPRANEEKGDHMKEKPASGG